MSTQQIFSLSSDDSILSTVVDKIDELTTLQDVRKIDTDFIQNLGNYLGYSDGASFDIIDKLTKPMYDTYLRTNLSDEDVTNLKRVLLRRLIENLPFQYESKGTRKLFRHFLLSLGIRGDIQPLYTSDYNSNIENWTGNVDIRSLESDADANIDEKYKALIGSDQYITPHFLLNINSDTIAKIIPQIKNLQTLIEDIKPATTVYRGIQSYTYTEDYSPSLYVPHMLTTAEVSVEHVIGSGDIPSEYTNTNSESSDEHFISDFDLNTRSIQNDFIYFPRLSGLLYEKMDILDGNDSPANIDSAWKKIIFETDSHIHKSSPAPINRLYFNIIRRNNSLSDDYSGYTVLFEVVKNSDDSTTFTKTFTFTSQSKPQTETIINSNIIDGDSYKYRITLTKNN